MIVNTAIANPVSTNNVPRIVFRQRVTKEVVGVGDEDVSELDAAGLPTAVDARSDDGKGFCGFTFILHPSAFILASERHADCF
jgi:hypothetical protein